MSKIDLVSFWYASGSVGMAPYVNTTLDGGHIDYEGVNSKVDLNTRMQTIVSALPDFFDSYTMKLTDVNLSGILVSKAECVLKSSGSSSSPDYTQVLTNINNSLVNIGVKLSTSQNGNNQTGIATILSNIFQYSNGASSIKSGATTTDSMNSANLIKQLNRLISMFYYSDPNYYEQINSSQKLLRYIFSTLKQTVSPNASITDVISALNATIDSKQDTTIVNNDNTNLVQVEGVLDYRLKPQDSM